MLTAMMARSPRVSSSRAMRARSGARMRVEHDRDALRVPGKVGFAVPPAFAIGDAVACERAVPPGMGAARAVLPEEREFARVDVHEVQPRIVAHANVRERPRVRGHQRGLNSDDAKVDRASNAVIALASHTSTR